ncbi:MAG: hypothetical protein ACXVCP_13440 [Bdellovibrio sp.]
MKLLGTLILFLIATTVAEARNFYRTEFTFFSDYTNIRTGSKDLFYDRVTVLFSDDGDFCYFEYKDREEVCKIAKQERFDDPVILLPLPLIKALFVAASENHKLAQNEMDAVKRLIELFPSDLYLSRSSGYVRYQLDDKQPEAIHVQISGLSIPNKY